VIVPTIAAGAPLLECIESLEGQTLPPADIIVVDSSGRGLAGRTLAGRRTRILENDRDAGFGAAINRAARESATPWLAVLHDDAAARPEWLRAMMAAVEPRPDVGMVASRILLPGGQALDSAGLLLCADGAPLRRGRGKPAETFSRRQEVLLASACAALYRREMFDEVGGFDERLLLCGEDVDLGLRARWKAWECLYTPDAIVEHRNSHSVRNASGPPAYEAERNRLFPAFKVLPLPMLLAMPFVSLARYFWQRVYARRGAAPASVLTIVRAWIAVLRDTRPLLADRRNIRRTRRLTPKQFTRILRRYSVSARQAAAPSSPDCARTGITGTAAGAR
jgi:GT2 family glycosyltransferase